MSAASTDATRLLVPHYDRLVSIEYAFAAISEQRTTPAAEWQSQKMDEVGRQGESTGEAGIQNGFEIFLRTSCRIP